MFKKSLVLFTIIAVSMFSGCQPKTSKAPSPTTPQNYQKSGTQLLPSLPDGNKSDRVPPKQIDSIRSSISSIMSDLDKKDWSKAKSKASTIRADISQLKASLNTLGITTETPGKITGTPDTTTKTPDNIIGNAGNAIKNPGNIIGNVGTTIRNPGNIIGNTGNATKNPNTTNRNTTTTDSLISQMTKSCADLDKSISTKKVYDSKANANQISKNLADVTQSYAGTSPAELDRLEYLCRQISLDAEKRDWVSAKSNLTTCKNTLGTLKTKLNGENNEGIANLNNNVAKLSNYVNTKNAKETAKYAGACLDNVQAIRKAPLKTR